MSDQPTTVFLEPFLHVDMDAFYVEVERLRDPSLRGRQVVVGGAGPRGVVAAASYEARRRGVHSAMPMVEARRRCPNGYVIPPDHARYSAVSDEVFAVLHSFTPLVEALSIDEAFLDVSGLRLHYRTPEDVGHAIRRAIREQIGIPASIGIAATKFLAKLASEKAKPDGLLSIEHGYELDFLHPLPVSDLWGVGESTRAGLATLGVTTVGALAVTPLPLLASRVGQANAAHLASLARGIDPRSVVIDVSARSISVEETFPVDLTIRAEVEEELLRLCDRLAARLRRAGMKGRTVTLKVRFADFTTITRSATRAEAIWRRPDLLDEAGRLLDRARVGGRSVRLLGVGVSHLDGPGDAEQMSLDHPTVDAVAEAAEEVRRRFGDGSVIPARLAPRRRIEGPQGER
jgi:DNA polymerase IV